MKKIYLIILVLVITTIIFFYILELSTKSKTDHNKLINTSTVKYFEEKPILNQEEIEDIKILEISKNIKKEEPVFDQIYYYLGIDYPNIYVYDPNDFYIKKIDLENKVKTNLIKSYNFIDGYLSKTKKEIVIKENKLLKIYNLENNKLYNTPTTTKKIVFSPEIILYLNDNKNKSYLSYFNPTNQKLTNIKNNLAILDPEFAILSGKLIIYENNKKPSFLLDLKTKDLSIFLKTKEIYSIINNKDENLIFVVSRENNNLVSQIIDQELKTKYIFNNLVTLKEKCTFEELLICAIPSNLNQFNPENWYLFNPSFDEKIIIFDPKNNNIKTHKLNIKADVVKPTLTPKGIIFWNRLDAKIYLLKID